MYWVLRKPTDAKPSKATSLMYACIQLHNFLGHNYRSCHKYFPPETFNNDHTNLGCVLPQPLAEWTIPTQPIQPARGRNCLTAERIKTHLLSTFWLWEEWHGKQTFPNNLLYQVVMKTQSILTKSTPFPLSTDVFQRFKN